MTDWEGRENSSYVLDGSGWGSGKGKAEKSYRNNIYHNNIVTDIRQADGIPSRLDVVYRIPSPKQTDEGSRRI